MNLRWNLSDAGWAVMGHRWTSETQARQFREDLDRAKKRTNKEFLWAL